MFRVCSGLSDFTETICHTQNNHFKERGARSSRVSTTEGQREASVTADERDVSCIIRPCGQRKQVVSNMRHTSKVTGKMLKISGPDWGLTCFSYGKIFVFWVRKTEAISLMMANDSPEQHTREGQGVVN